MNLKKMTALFLSSIMTLSSVFFMSLNIMASSKNTVNRVVTVKEGDVINNLYLKIVPNDSIDYGDSIIVTPENAFFDLEKVSVPEYNLQGLTWEDAIGQYIMNHVDGDSDWNANSFGDILWNYIIMEGNAKIPWKFAVNGNREVEIFLFPIPESLVGEFYAGTSKPYYYIPLPFVAEKEGDVKISIDNNGTSVTRGSNIVIAKVLSGDSDISGGSSFPVGEGSSVNYSANKMVSVKTGEKLSDVYLNIEPFIGVEYGDYVIIKLKNGIIADDTNLEDYQYKSNRGMVWSAEDGVSGAIDQYKMNHTGENAVIWNSVTFGNILHTTIIAEDDAKLPYNIIKNNSHELKVELFPLPEDVAGENYMPYINKPHYMIPLPVTAENKGSVTATVCNSAYDGQTFKIANVLDQNGNVVGGDDTGVILGGGSSNFVNKEVIVKDGDWLTDVYLSIRPKFGIEYGDSIKIKINNGVISDGLLPKYNIADAQVWSAEDGVSGAIDQYKLNHTGENAASWNRVAFGNILRHSIIVEGDTKLPWNFIKNSSNEFEVELFPLPASMAGVNYEGTGIPYYSIPLPITANGKEGDITISIDANGSSIKDGDTIKVGEIISSTAGTVISVDDVSTSISDVEISTATIKELVYGTFVPGKIVTLKLNDGFEFSVERDVVENLSVSAGINAEFKPLGIKDINIDGNTLEFVMPQIGNGMNGGSVKAASIKISGLCASPVNKENNGDVTLTVSGESAGIREETIKVGEYNGGALYSEDKKHDIDGISGLGVNDVSILMQKVLDNGSYPEIKASEHDVDGNGVLTANDVSILFKRVLSKEFIYPNFK